MKIFSAQKVRDADTYTIKHEPISSIDLMERAGIQCSEWLKAHFISDIFEKTKNFKIFVGPGNNGGDGLVIARHLTSEVQRWFFDNSKVKIYIVQFTDKFSDDFKINLDRLKKTNQNIYTISANDELLEINKDDIVIDAIFGSGLSRPVKGLPEKFIEHINNSPSKSIISIDIPSGLFAEENHKQKQTIVQADHTLTFEFPFLSFFFPENQNYIKNTVVLPIGLHQKYINKTETPYYIIEKSYIRKTLKPRLKYSHKGNFGHGLLIAGSYGKMGAAILATKAAHRAGIGLLTAHVTNSCVDVVHNASPETMLDISKFDLINLTLTILEKFNAVAIGPAINLNTASTEVVKKLIKSYKAPLVIDADAITILGQNKELLEKLPKNSILTPHPKEFERIAGKTSNNYQRLQKQIELSEKYNIYIILKGANTSISCPDGKCYFNITGNPGMATGGSGDVLTGMILSFLAQGYKPKDASILSVYLHGQAGDIAAKEYGFVSLTPSDIINNIHKAILAVSCWQLAVGS